MRRKMVIKNNSFSELKINSFICLADLETLALDPGIIVSRANRSNSSSSSRAGEEVATTATSTTRWPISTASTATTEAPMVGPTLVVATMRLQTGGVTEGKPSGKQQPHFVYLNCCTVCRLTIW